MFLRLVHHGAGDNVVMVMVEWQLFHMAGYLIEERRRWPVIIASPRGQCSEYIQNLEGKACSDEEAVPVTWSDKKLILLYFPGRGWNSRPPAHRSFKHGVPRP